MALQLILPKQASEAHIQIPGTAIFLVPPPGFKVSENFKGFQNPTDLNSMIKVMELPIPFYRITAGFSKFILRLRRMRLKSKTKVEFYGYQGLLLKLAQKVKGKRVYKHVLVYGDSAKSIMVIGIYPKADELVGAEIQSSLMSIFIDTDYR
ncbi:MAG: hypothetical protein AAGA10_30825 [Bacteroidota bacterium]